MRFMPLSLALPVALLLALPTEAGLLFNGDLETGNLSQFPEKEVCCAHSATAASSPVRAGRYSARFELRKGEMERSEILPPSNRTGAIPTAGRLGDVRWFGFSIFIPREWVNDTESAQEIIWQVHEYPDACESWRSPPSNLMISGGKWVYNKRYQANECSKGNDGVSSYHELGTLAKEQWTDFVVNVKWSYGSDGYTKIWKNGELVFDHKGPNYYNDKSPGYVKYGIYKWGWVSNPGASVTNIRVMYMDQIRIGDQNSSYTEVAPAGSGESLPPPSSPSPSPSPSPSATSTPVPVMEFPQSSGSGFQNKSIPTQAGAFVAEMDLLPLVNSSDAVTMLAGKTVATYTDAAILVRLNSSGFIDVRNGGKYEALQSVPYSAGKRYKVRIDADVERHTYSVTVVPEGGAAVQIARDYAFRNEQSAVSTLQTLAITAERGSHQVQNLRLSTIDAPAPTYGDLDSFSGVAAPLKSGCGGNESSTIYVLRCNGYLGKSVQIRESGNYRITIRAAGRGSNAGTVKMETRVDGSFREGGTVSSTMRDYSVTVPLAAGSRRITGHFVNDATGRDLAIEKITITRVQ